MAFDHVLLVSEPHFFGGASTPEKTSTASGRRCPRISIALTAEFSSVSSAGVNRTPAAPLLLLHGGMFHTEMFGPNLTKLAQSRQVIGVDLQGHGHTPLGDREISLVDIGNDMAGVLKKLGYDKVDVLGYSMGGGVAFQLAAQHPEMVRRLPILINEY